MEAKTVGIDSAVDGVLSWIQDAVGDMSADYADLLDEEWRAKVHNAIDNGVQDVRGWLADEYYNDVGTLEDLVGDRIYDEAIGICSTSLATPEGRKEHDRLFIMICEAMKERAHTALKQALDNLIERHSK